MHFALRKLTNLSPAYLKQGAWGWGMLSASPYALLGISAKRVVKPNSVDTAVLWSGTTVPATNTAKCFCPSSKKGQKTKKGQKKYTQVIIPWTQKLIGRTKFENTLQFYQCLQLSFPNTGLRPTLPHIQDIGSCLSMTSCRAGGPWGIQTTQNQKGIVQCSLRSRTESLWSLLLMSTAMKGSWCTGPAQRGSQPHRGKHSACGNVFVKDGQHCSKQRISEKGILALFLTEIQDVPVKILRYTSRGDEQAYLFNSHEAWFYEMKCFRTTPTFVVIP